jgi:hypothetical protein
MAQLTGPTEVFPVNSTERSATAQLPLGTKAYDKNGYEYTYVKAGADIAAADAVRFAGSVLGFDDVRPTSAANQYVLGAADGTAFTTGQFGFVKTKGVAVVKTVVSTAAGSLVIPNATAGTLALATTSQIPGQRPIVALVTGVAAGSEVYLG